MYSSVGEMESVIAAETLDIVCGFLLRLLFSKALKVTHGTSYT